MIQRTSDALEKSMWVGFLSASISGAGLLLPLSILRDPRPDVLKHFLILLFAGLLWGAPGALVGLVAFLCGTQDQERLEREGYLRPKWRIILDAALGVWDCIAVNFSRVTALSRPREEG